MEIGQPTPAPRVATRRLPRPAGRLVQRMAQMDTVAAISTAVIFVLVAAAIFGPALAPQDPDAVDLSAAYQAPSAAHVLGTDGSGRDLFSRLFAGARTSLAGPFIVMLLATSIGTAVAVASAWRGGWVDQAIARTLDALFAFPGLLLAFLAVAVFGTGFVAPVIALVIANIPWVARIVRSVAAPGTSAALRRCT